MNEKLVLYGFNNLTKSLSFNIYDVCITDTNEVRESYIKYIDEVYNSKKVTDILLGVCDRIGASVLNISKQDYDPQGASVTILISEEEVPMHLVDDSCNAGVLTPLPTNVVSHLDKSHITVHTYPESHPEMGISTFRVDIDVATCGEISPLKALDFLIESFDSDIITVDYKVRGFTRADNGKKIFIDHKIDSIRDYISDETLAKYRTVDMNIHHENIFHTKMMLDELNLDEYLFGTKESDLSEVKRKEIKKTLKHEIKEIFYGRNLKHD